LNPQIIAFFTIISPTSTQESVIYGSSGEDVGVSSGDAKTGSESHDPVNLTLPILTQPTHTD
jgi:hypothetical protein